MTSIKDSERGWKAHDTGDLKECDKIPGWNPKMGHSKFNPGCKGWVENWVKKNPVPKGTCPECKRTIIPKHKCANCGDEQRETRMWQEPLKGNWVCCRRCERATIKKIEAEAGKAKPVPG